MNKQSVRDVDVSGKRVLVRVDFNVPVDVQGAILDDTRIRASVPTIAYLREHGARIVLVSHMGRPKGGPDPALSLRVAAVRLAQLLSADVTMAPDAVGPSVEQMVLDLQPGQVLMLENVRFHPEEEYNDQAYARQLARLGDLFVNDAFGSAHRAHASTTGVAAYLPAVSGFLLEKEIDYLSRVLESPERPFAAVVGGAKISTKTAVLSALVRHVNILVLGGAMACTFLKAQGHAVGDSLVEDDQLDAVRALVAQARERDVNLLLQHDAVVASAFSPDAPHQVVQVDAIPAGWRVMDIGPETCERIRNTLLACRTILWNGPVGVAEFPAFAHGTEVVARAMASSDAVTVIGGGETVAAVEAAGVAGMMSHISTGGGATLEFLEGRTLPGVAALLDRPAV